MRSWNWPWQRWSKKPWPSKTAEVFREGKVMHLETFDDWKSDLGLTRYHHRARVT